MGIATTLYKVIAWSVSGFFLGTCGALYGNIMRHIDPEEVAFDGPGLGVWMVLMAVLGGKGSLWGPLIGAVFFIYLRQELQDTQKLLFLLLGIALMLSVLIMPYGIASLPDRIRDSRWAEDMRRRFKSVEMRR